MFTNFVNMRRVQTRLVVTTLIETQVNMSPYCDTCVIDALI